MADVKWLVTIVLLAGVLCIVFFWFRWRGIESEKTRDLAALEELVREYARGLPHSAEQIKWLMTLIEHTHPPSAALTMRLDRVRQMLRERGDG